MGTLWNSIKIIISDIKIFSNNSLRQNLLTKNLSFFYILTQYFVTKLIFQQLFNYNFKPDEEINI